MFSRTSEWQGLKIIKCSEEPLSAMGFKDYQVFSRTFEWQALKITKCLVEPLSDKV